ncbi:12016_t:CDS:2 [Rhizophagus irregularis]|nr:12016_t:CDS:2 [Rhizophagus irregularis]
MSDINLSCLIQGTDLDKYFKISIDKNSDIYDLKETIWNKKKNTFSSIDANDLILWKVKVPISDKEKFKQLEYTESIIEDVLGGTKLNDATVGVKEIFGNSPAKKHIHIIIGQPTTEQSTNTTQKMNQEIPSLTQQAKAMSLEEESDEYNDRSVPSENTRTWQSSRNNSSRSNFRQGTNPFGTSPFGQNKRNNGMNNQSRINLTGKTPLTCKILLLGGTGTGKSTIINMMANYFLSGTLENPKVVIPTKYFKVTENDFVRNNSEAKIADVTRSQTTSCCNYEFKHPGNSFYDFIFIDTPGMSDTNGIDQDDKNIEEIVNAAINVGSLTAIVIIASGTEARVTPTIMNTIIRLRNSLPDEIVYNNLLLILTKCTKSSACFSEDAFANEIAKPKQIFYMDNQVFCTDPQIWLNDEDEYSIVQHQWNKSFKTFDNLLKMITEMNATSTKAFTEMRDLHCGLEFTGNSGTTNFNGCYCMGSDNKCTECGCDTYSHFHTNVEMKTETKTINKVINKVLEDVKAQYDMADADHKRISNDANQFQQAFAKLQAKADDNYNKIRQLCSDLSKICSRFNFVDELNANIKNMKLDAKTLKNLDLRDKAESEIRKLEAYIDGLSRQG